MSNYVNITASVGKNGKNKIEDIFPIQMLLNKFIIPGCLKPRTFIQQDGIVGPKTIDAIRDFQRRIVGLQNPDGRIDPGGKTLSALNGPLVWAKPVAADKTFDWAIALGAIDNGKVEFKLVNRATGEQKTIVIRRPGISAISIHKSFTERWVTFRTFLAAGFSDFDKRNATFAKGWFTVGAHRLDIPGIGSIPVAPYPEKSLTESCAIYEHHGIFASTMLGCNFDTGPAVLGQTSIDLTVPAPFPVPKLYPNTLWVPSSSMLVLLLAP